MIQLRPDGNNNSILQTKDTVGRGIGIGNQVGVLLFVHRQCVPCLYNEKKSQLPGLMETLWHAAGVNCQILQGGRIHVGDRVQVLTRAQLETSLLQGNKATVPAINPGDKPPGFFVPPKERTAEMVKQGLEGRKRAYEKYSVRDPVGSARATRSFATVGLSFWPSSCMSNT